MHQPLLLPFFAAPLMDLAIPRICCFAPIALILLIVVTILETITFHFTNFKPWKRSLKVSSLMNLVSTGLGVPLFMLIPPLSAHNPLHFILLFVLSIVVEYPVFYWLTRDRSWEGVKRVALVNAVSYAALAILVFGFMEP